MRRLRTFLLVFIGILALLVAAAWVLPWQGIVQQKLVAALAARGFASPVLTIDHIGLRGLVLKDVSVGEPALKLANLTVAYDPRAALKGRIDDITIDGLALRAVQTDSGWQIEGMGDMMKPSGKPVAIPVTLAQLNQLPLRSIALRNATLTMVGKTWQAELPLEGQLQHGTDATLHLESNSAQLTMDRDSIALNTIVLDLTLDDVKQQWRGNWSIKDIATNSETLTVPPLAAQGDAIVGTDIIDATAKLTSADKSYIAAFAIHYAFNEPSASLVTLNRVAMPLSGGSVSIGETRIPLAGTNPIALKLTLSKVAIDGVINGLTGDKATATGTVSGAIPITIGRSGEFRIGNTALTADGPGKIALSPDVIPGDSPQLALARDILKDLHYSILALGLDMSPSRELKAVLVVEGKNPAMENGRAIKLKVQLSGDLLNLLLQNLKLMTDPKTFIEQSNHEKH